MNQIHYHETVSWRLVTAMVLVMVSSPLLFLNCGKKEKTPERKGPSFTIHKVLTPPVIDGILNDECWKNAESETLKLSKDGKKPEYPTTVRAVYSESCLFIGFECQDPDASSSITERDGPIATQECISIYLDAEGNSRTYIVIDIAPTGAVSDAFVISYNDGERETVLRCWNTESIRVSVSISGGGAQHGTKDRFWTVEAAVPLDDILSAPHIPPVSSDAWRANFTRRDMTKLTEYSAFIPTGTESFNKPSSFAWMIFGD